MRNHQVLLNFQHRHLALSVLLFANIFGLSGCIPKPLYDWGKYEDSLYLRYTDNNFSQAESYISETLPTPAHPSKVPPGVYADYGFLLYRRGDHTGAIQYFEKEKQVFPESSALMTKLIDRVRQKVQPDDSSKIKSNTEIKRAKP